MPLTIFDNTTINDENYLRAAQLDKDWPNGRALYVNGDKTFVMKINYIDHLEIIVEQYKITHVEEVEVMKPPPNNPDGKPVKSIERKFTFDYVDIFKAFNNICEASKVIEQFSKFAKSESLGFLTSLPGDLGFFEMSVNLKMPNIWKMIKHCNEKKDIEDFTHYNILKKYMVQVHLFDYEGWMQIRPIVINQTRAYRA